MNEAEAKQRCAERCMKYPGVLKSEAAQALNDCPARPLTASGEPCPFFWDKEPLEAWRRRGA